MLIIVFILLYNHKFYNYKYNNIESRKYFMLATQFFF